MYPPHTHTTVLPTCEPELEPDVMKNAAQRVPAKQLLPCVQPEKRDACASCANTLIQRAVQTLHPRLMCAIGGEQRQRATVLLGWFGRAVEHMLNACGVRSIATAA